MPGLREILPTELQALLGTPDAPLLVDVREDWEVTHCPFPGTLHIPLGALAERADEVPLAPVVVTVCHHGVRSLHAAMILRAAGHRDVRSLHGGTDLWAVDVDPAMVRY